MGTAGRCRETLVWGWALQGDSGVGVGHSRQNVGLGTPVSGFGVGHSRVSVVGHSRESLGWALQGVSRIRPGEEKS